MRYLVCQLTDPGDLEGRRAEDDGSGRDRAVDAHPRRPDDRPGRAAAQQEVAAITEKLRSAKEAYLRERTIQEFEIRNPIQVIWNFVNCDIYQKDVGTARRSASPQHYFRIVVGEGNSGGRNVMISRKLIDYRRTALETKDFQDDFTLQAQ